MVARACILIILAASKGCFWVLEQPRGSLLQQHPGFQKVLQLLRVWRKHIKMGNFGAATEKGTWLYSGYWIQSIPKERIFFFLDIFRLYTSLSLFRFEKHNVTTPAITVYLGHEAINQIDDYELTNIPNQPGNVSLVDHYVDRQGVSRVKGNKQLKASQAYPRLFLGIQRNFHLILRKLYRRVSRIGTSKIQVVAHQTFSGS